VSWPQVSLWLATAAAAAGLAVALRWAFAPERVAARAGTLLRDPRTVRRLGVVLAAIFALFLLVRLYDVVAAAGGGR